MKIGAEGVAMAITLSIQEFLRSSDVDYAVFRHPMAFTAQEEAR
jgi:hypothetical protein